MEDNEVNAKCIKWEYQTRGQPRIVVIDEESGVLIARHELEHPLGDGDTVTVEWTLTIELQEIAHAGPVQLPLDPTPREYANEEAEANREANANSER